MSAFKMAIACVGAMMGAGFASGREMCVFFSSYGAFSWVLIGVAVLMMMFLYFLVLSARQRTNASQWMQMYENAPRYMQQGLRFCVGLLFLIVGAGMVSASGHLFMLLWGHPLANIMGSLGTLLLAWVLAQGHFRFMTLLSTFLTVLFVLLHVLLLWNPPTTSALFPLPSILHMGTWLSTIGYAAMNLTLSIGVISKPTNANKTQITVYFGILMGILLSLSNALYQTTGVATSAFPMVTLLTMCFGHVGFLVSLLLLYLAVLTTLIAIVCGLRGIVSTHSSSTAFPFLLLSLLVIAQLGFEGIVTWLYAPIGLLCLLFVFTPLQKA